MALNVFTDTMDPTPVRDPVWYELQCNGYRTTAPVAAVFTLTLLQQPDPGMTFTLDLDGTEVSFTFVNGTPDDSGTQVQLGDNTTETLENLGDALLSNWDVDQLFHIALGETEHTLTAREERAMPIGFTNTAPPTVGFNQSVAGTDAVYAENYSAVHQIWLERARGTGIYDPLPARDGRPDKMDRRTRWDMQGMLRDCVEVQWPQYGQTLPTFLRKLTRKYYITRYEQYGTPPLPRSVRRSVVKTAWFAGSRIAEHRVMPEVFTLLRTTAQPTPFLTYRGRAGRHEVSPAQQHYLAWYRNTNKVADQQVYVKATVHYLDETTDTSVLYTDTNASDWQVGEVISIPTGFEKRGLHLLQASKTPTHYTVQVFSHTDTVLSELYTFHLRVPDANELHLEWYNSLGVVESTRCVGQWVRGVRTEHDVVDRVVYATAGQQPSPETSQRAHFLRGVDNTLQLSTGFMDRAELDATLDLLYCDRLYVLDHERGLRMPFIPTAGEYIEGQRGTPDENLYALNLEGLITHSERARSQRTSMPSLPPIDPDPDGGGEDM